MTDTLVRDTGTNLNLSDEALVYIDNVIVAVKIRLWKPTVPIRVEMGLRRKATLHLITPDAGYMTMVEDNGGRRHPRSKGLFLGSQTRDDFDFGQLVDPANRWLLQVGMRFVFKAPLCRPELSADMVTAITI